jgi:hypothetical protein
MERAHLIVGGYPPGSSASHDMEFARRELLSHLGERSELATTVSSDFGELEKWLTGTQFLVTYTAGPYPNDEQQGVLTAWLEHGGRWLGFHGTSGGKAARVEGSFRRKMVKLPHHETLGSFFLNHPPIRRFEVTVADSSHPITQGLPERFDVADELYLIEIMGECNVLLTTELPVDPSPEAFGFLYDEDTSLQADGKTRVLGYTKTIGNGEVAYIALGHCHSPATDGQRIVDTSVSEDGMSPGSFHGVWDETNIKRLVDNAIGWGLGEPASVS